MKSLLILGGNYSQIPAIKKAKEMGHYVITCDNLKNNLGHQYADEHHDISYTDREGVFALAKKLKIDGISCFATDAAATTVAYVAEKLGIPSNPYKSVEIISNKEKFRKFLKVHHFSVPKTKAYHSYEEIKSDFHNLDLPVMIKPVDSSASRGVAKIESYEMLQKKVEQALNHSMEKRFVIEEYIVKQSYQITGDIFYVNGKIAFRTFANSHFLNPSIKPVNPFVPIGPSWPSIFPDDVQDKIHNEIQRLIELLDLKTGALNFDIQIDRKGNIYFLDMGARNGGNLIPTVTKYATGVDMIEYTIKAALGEDCTDLKMVEPKGYWAAYLLSSQKNGIFKGIDIDEEIKKNNIVEYDLTVKLDDNVFAYTGSNVKLGTMILKFSSIEEMIWKMDNLEKFIDINIDESLGRILEVESDKKK